MGLAKANQIGACILEEEAVMKGVKHKFGAIRCEYDGIKFPSRLEKRYYEKLKLMVKAGKIVMFLRQPLFDLGAGITYKADFLEFHNDGTVRVVDVKGMPPT